MTAVDFIVQKLNPLVNAMPNDIYSTICNIMLEAKKMEKEQMEDCWIAAHQTGRFEGKGIAQEDWQTFFNYYNEIYK
jgi:hypothetical protein